MSTGQLATLLWVSYGLFCLGSALDMVSTWLLVRSGRHEAARPAKWIMARVGLNGWLALNVALLIVLALANRSLVHGLWRGLGAPIYYFFALMVGLYLLGGLFRTIVTYRNLR